MIRILVVDDHEIVRTGIRALLETYPIYKVVGQAVDGNEAIAVAIETKPDVVILDYLLPPINGLQVTRAIRDCLPATEILLLTMHYSDQFVEEAIRVGARGCLLKSDASRDLIPAINAVRARRPYFTNKVADTLINKLLGRRDQPHSYLTNREREVVTLVAEGHHNNDIAKILKISLVTVENHRASALRKLRLGSSAGLVRYAVRNKLVDS